MSKEDLASTLGEFSGFLLRLLTALEDLPSRDEIVRLTAALDRLQLPEPKAVSAENPVWMTVKEAAERSRFGIDFIYDMGNQGRLWIAGDKNGKKGRILRIHLDEQIAKGFPRLEMDSLSDILERCSKKTSDDLRRLAPGRRLETRHGREEYPKLKLPEKE